MRESYLIMIVEDEPALAELLMRLILRRYPTATIQIYWNGQDALDDYDRTRADLLLIDRGVPGMDGITLTRTLRARGDSVPIIGMSGDPMSREDYMAAGATSFVSGVDVFDQIKELVQRVLSPPLSH